MQFVLKEITARGVMSPGKKMGYVNNFTKVIHCGEKYLKIFHIFII